MHVSKSLLVITFVFACPILASSQPKEELMQYMRGLGNGAYLFGQIGTWVHNANPDMDDPGYVQLVCQSLRRTSALIPPENHREIALMCWTG